MIHMKNKHKPWTRTTVKHKKNFQRTLNRFAERFNFIDMEVNENARTCTFFCQEWLSDILNRDKLNIVFDKVAADESMRSYDKVMLAIESMFEHGKFIPLLKQVVEEYADKIVSVIDTREHRVTKFLTHRELTLKYIELALIRTYPQQDFSERFIVKLYNNIRNRVVFKFLYTDENGAYIDYHESKEGRYGTRSRYTKKTPALEQRLREHYDFYLEYWQFFTLKRAKEFAYYLDTSKDGYEFPFDDDYVESWRENYRFLSENGIIKSFYESIDFIGQYLEPFGVNHSEVVSLVSEDGRVFESRVQKHLEEHHPDRLNDLKMLTIMYRAIQHVISPEDQVFIMQTYQMPTLDDMIEQYGR